MAYNKTVMFFFQKPENYYRQDFARKIRAEKNGYEYLTLYEELLIESLNKDGVLANFFDDKIVRVILTEEDIDKFTTNEKELNECEKLYISSDILLTSKQSKMFKNYNIELFIIPEYYFEDEIREVA